MTEQQIQELRELRIAVQTREHQLDVLEMEKADVQMEIRQLNRWKKGRWVGFVLSLIAFVICTFAFVSYAEIQFEASVGRSQNYSDAFAYSVSSASILFAGLFLLISFLISLILGIKLMTELGNSKPTRNYARNSFKKNYYNEMEECESRENTVMRELIELKKIQADDKNRIAVLEKMESPWNE